MTATTTDQGGDIPIFKPIFGDAWDALPPVMHLHYANRPFCRDTHVADGVMTVRASPLMRLMAPISHALGAIPIANEADIPVTVTFRSEENSRALVFDRLFHLKGRKPYRFRSRMLPVGGNQIVEQMRFGLGWRVAFSAKGDRVLLTHQGYALTVAGKLINLPLDWLMGRVSAQEWATGPDSFGMAVTIDHWLFGQIYEYRGTFRMMDNGRMTDNGVGTGNG